MKKFSFYVLIGLIVTLGACQKEKSFQVSGVPGDGTLQSEISGDCLPKTINGSYEVGKALVAATNTITVDVEITRAGTYQIYTDTVNGFYFRGSGTFTAVGAQTVTLRGNGTPFAAGIHTFAVHYGMDVCDIQVTVDPAGGAVPAVFTLVSTGTPAVCGTTINGTYIKDAPLTAANTVRLNVNTTTAGSFTVTTVAANGMTFSGTGTLATGAGFITLRGTGTPTNVATTTIPVTAGATICSFDIPVTAGAAFTIDCPNVTPNGTYTVNVALISTTNTLTVPITVTSAGPYSITTTAANGMTFSGNGNVTLATTSIILNGTGTPTAAASPTTNVTITFGAATCSVAITVAPPAAPAGDDWKFNDGAVQQGDFDNGVLVSTTIPPPAPPMTITGYSFSGSNATNSFLLSLADIAGGINAGEVYSTGAVCSCNNANFVYTDATLTPIYEANATTTGTTFKVTVATHNTTTKTITGTFSGTVKFGATTKNITAGTFTGTYN